jgi:hypothetical protein
LGSATSNERREPDLAAALARSTRDALTDRGGRQARRSGTQTISVAPMPSHIALNPSAPALANSRPSALNATAYKQSV